MNIGKVQFWLTAAAAVNVGIASQAMASGYEKSIIWGGRSAGVAGIATPYITGSQALYFNPAGLVGDEVGADLSLNISPTWAQFKGPINDDAAQEEGDTTLSTPGAVIYGRTMSDTWGFGIGAYVSGGSMAEYENVQFPSLASGAEVKTDLMIAEFAAGAGYKVNEDLKLGLAYRMVMAQADFSLVQRLPSGLIANAKLTDLEDTNYEGFKFGAQYKLSDKTLLGFTYRSEVNLEAEGDSHVVILNGGELPPTTAELKTTFPMAATLGVLHDFNESWRLLGEYVWTQYSRVGEIPIDVATGTDSSIQQRWDDQHNIRIAGEYLGTDWPVRAGYIWTSQVTDEAWARATFTPPGIAHTLTLGTGKTFEVMDNPLQFDVAGEYTMTEGDAEGPGSADIVAGTYEAVTYALHLGLTYGF